MEPKFKVGDKVRHIHRPDWGVGTVIEVDCGELSVEVQADGKIGSDNEPADCVRVMYPTFRGDQWLADWESGECDWYTFPHNLESVDEQD